MKKLYFKKFNVPIPIILGSYVNALGIIRSFADRKIPTICVDYKKNLAGYSKYTIFFKCPHPVNEYEKFINFLIDLSKNIKNKGIFFATNDIWLIPISKNEKILEKHFYFPFPPWNILEDILDKYKLYNKIKGEISIPDFFLIKSINDIKKIKSSFEFPFFLKSVDLVQDIIKKNFNTKVLKVSDENKLEFFFGILKNEDLNTHPIIAQENIKGEINNLYTFSSYTNRDYNIVAYSIGHKIRQYPLEAGTITSGQLDNNSFLYSLMKKVIKKTKFYGMSNVEYKYDINENIFKLVEMNPRPGMWNWSAFSSGINLPYITYCDFLSIDYKINKSINDKLVWVDLIGDINSYLKLELNKNKISKIIDFIKWIISIKGERVFAVESFKDPGPMFIGWTKFFYHIIKNFLKKCFIKKQ
jgi:D-aspartate ligase